jgi:spore maturation protein A
MRALILSPSIGGRSVKLIGDAIRVILNINTIWGLMILTAFGFCMAQHYAPTYTELDFSDVPPGEVTFSVVPPDGEDNEQVLLLKGQWDGSGFQAQPIEHASSSIVKRADVQALNGKQFLVWDAAQPGKYTLLFNGDEVATIKLVNLQTLTDAAFDYAKIGFNIALGLVAAMVLMLGLMKVGEAAGVVQIVARALYPLIRFLFPDVPKDHPASNAILMNITTAILGLGNAATPFGLKAMNELQKLNPHKDVASDSQIMLLGYNTAGFALLPTTLIAVRQSAGCSNPFEIIGTCMVAGMTATITAIIMVKFLGALPFFSIASAVAESDSPQSNGQEG